MKRVEAFFHDLDAEWSLPADRIELQVIGSTALFLQTDYSPGTKDSDVLETEQLRGGPLREALEDLAGRGRMLHERHGMYLEFVGRGLPLLPHGPEWVLTELPLRHWMDSRSDRLPQILERFHRVERDWYGRAHTATELPEGFDR